MELACARAAAVVRALPYRLGTRLDVELIRTPFLGASMSTVVDEMVKTGTSKTLEAHRLGAARGGELKHVSTGRPRGGRGVNFGADGGDGRNPKL
jgi:hypothetical protein